MWPLTAGNPPNPEVVPLRTLFDQVCHPAGHFPAAAPCRAGNRITVFRRSGRSRCRDTGHEGGRGLSALILLDTGQPFLKLKLIGGDRLINQCFDTLAKIKQFFQSELIELAKSGTGPFPWGLVPFEMRGGPF